MGNGRFPRGGLSKQSHRREHPDDSIVRSIHHRPHEHPERGLPRRRPLRSSTRRSCLFLHTIRRQVALHTRPALPLPAGTTRTRPQDRDRSPSFSGRLAPESAPQSDPHNSSDAARLPLQSRPTGRKRFRNRYEAHVARDRQSIRRVGFSPPALGTSSPDGG